MLLYKKLLLTTFGMTLVVDKLYEEAITLNIQELKFIYVFKRT
jgi:hypothetical protein